MAPGHKPQALNSDMELSVCLCMFLCVSACVHVCVCVCVRAGPERALHQKVLHACILHGHKSSQYLHLHVSNYVLRACVRVLVCVCVPTRVSPVALTQVLPLTTARPATVTLSGTR